MNHQILLNPGPVNVSERVRQALLIPDTCHREKEFSELLLRIRQNLLSVLEIEKSFTSVILTGSGTAALEAGVLAAASGKGKLLVLTNGIYGDRIAEIAQRHRIPTIVLRFPYHQRFILERIEETLKRNRTIRAIAMVHHETSTGMSNPIGEIGKLSKQYRKWLLVDAISSLAGDPLDFEKENVDFCVGTAGKCLHAFPGACFVLFRKSISKEIAKQKPSSLYFDIGKIWQLQEKGDIPFTPAVQLYSAFSAALDELVQETLPMRIESYRQRAQLLRKGFDELELEYLLPVDLYSNTLTSLRLPQGFTYEKLHDPLKEEGFVIYAGQNHFKRQIFRVAHMGNIPEEELKRFLEVLGKILSVAVV
jgi:2-aminoethylphosphonate-pyruvate transaminase